MESHSSSVEQLNAADTRDLSGFLVSWVNGQGEREEGPLSLLWQLIESYRIDIFDISLLRITQDFLEFLNAAKDLRLELASSFSVMAARLLFYKSRALLPDPGFDEPDTEDRLPPELIQQLLEYRKFQLAADRFQDLVEITSGMLTRQMEPEPESAPGDSEEGWIDVSLLDLVKAYQAVLERVERDGQEEEGYTVSADEYSVADKIAMIRTLLESSISFGFEDLFPNPEQMRRGEVISTFLALLELVRASEIIIRQRETFGEIHIFKKTVSVG